MAIDPVGICRPPVQLSPTALRTPPPRAHSPDRSSVPNYQILDPLLRSLSPESTLNALSSTDAVPRNEKAAHDILSRSISQVSPAERALGIRAAVAAQHLHLWYREIQAWSWPKRADVHLGKGFVPPTDSAEEHYGGLPTAVVAEHEKRIEEIRDGLDGLDVDELKEHVLNAHIPARSRPSSANSTVSVPPPLSYVQLSDFTTVITATILRVLPLLSRLNSLLATWDVRLLVLRQVPGLLRGLHRAQSELESASALLKSSDPPGEEDVLYSRANYHAKRVALESAVLSAGCRMDRLLDALEGREDSLPESWIDDLEAIEADFGSWVMEAEKRAVENEWRRMLANTKKDAMQQELSQGSPAKSISKGEDAERSVRAASEPVLQTARPSHMETIVEEVLSPVESVRSRQCHDYLSVAPAPTTVAPSVLETPPSPSDRCAPQPSLEDPITKPRESPATSEPVVDNDAIADSTSVTSSSDSINPRSVSSPQSHEDPAMKEELDLSNDDTDATNSPTTNTPDSRPTGPESFQNEPRSRETPSKPVVHERDTTPYSPLVSDAAPASELSRSQQSPVDRNTTVVAELAPVLANEDNATSDDSSLRNEPAHVEETSLPVETFSEDSVCSMNDDQSSSSDPNEAERTSDLSQSQPAVHREPSLDQEDYVRDSEHQSPLESTCLPAVQDQVPPTIQTDAHSATQHPDSIANALPSPTAVKPETTPESAASGMAQAKDSPRSLDDAPNQLHVASTDEATALPFVTARTTPGEARAINLGAQRSRLSVTPPPERHQNSVSLVDDKKHETAAGDGHENEAPNRRPKKPLESPIKLSTARPDRTSLGQNIKPRVRRESNISAGTSDYPSLVSSPDIREPRTTSSNGTPLALQTPPHIQPNYRATSPTPPKSAHTLREDRLVRLDSQKRTPPTAFKHNRALSLPLERFINESMNFDYDPESGDDADTSPAAQRATRASADLSFQTERRPVDSPHHRSSTPTNGPRRPARGRLEPPLEETTVQGSVNSHKKLLNPWEHNKNAFVKNSSSEATHPEPAVAKHSTTKKLRKQLTAHPSLESIGSYKTKSRPAEQAPASSARKTGSRSSTPTNQLRKPRDHLDEKISSILTTIPTRIRLMSSEEHPNDGRSASSSLPLKARERFRSVSPSGPPSRSSTPAPSLMLTPAMPRRRLSHAPEEGSVKLYHLHQNGKSAPTKLFVRAVGESGERVMVRVGGGWADLGEYLREYAIHHGRRHVSETPRVEVEGISSRGSTPTGSPGNRYSPSGNGRTTPSRPRSVISNRPASSLDVRKKRRPSNVSDVTDFRAASAGEALNLSFSPMSSVSRRRLSVSSNASFGATSSVSEARHGSPAVPLGLAGPTPRSRQVSMTPESEAWVEDVLGQARRSSSLKPSRCNAPPQESEPVPVKVPSLPKSRSISDIGKAGSSRRIALRGLGNR
ncbi:GAS2 domain protein [Aspergillus candidus]|uniref:GAR domain-containing protein n=1 Tax=Aspergillus candidus TaxID=41067 RepID=A0A2I2FKG2_ASPCN|nr:hypothetical protein BDW47DRAFT_75412 [Aspergillus candidus]PLB41110.1 hypothetical protein BDW47DRAFT_75412 [Aspergillus candidus]